MRLAAKTFMVYSAMRATALFVDPTKLHGVVPGVDLSDGADAEVAQVASAYALAISVLLFAAGLVSLGGVKGRSVCMIGYRRLHVHMQSSNPPIFQSAYPMHAFFLRGM